MPPWESFWKRIEEKQDATLKELRQLGENIIEMQTKHQYHANTLSRYGGRLDDLEKVVTEMRLQNAKHGAQWSSGLRTALFVLTAVGGIAGWVLSMLSFVGKAGP
jgi:hypothetical protein